MNDTIFAVSSGRPPAAIAVLRVSGPAAFTAMYRLAGASITPRKATLRTIRDPAGAPLDRALVLAFPGPTTATGEDLVEFHLHGGRAVVAAVETALGALPGLRPAVAGEFTRRALENGRLDLAQVQGLADLLAAETEAERKSAFAAAEGEISRAVAGWLSRISQASAQIEAALDYSDEDDVASSDLSHITAEVADLASEIASVLDRPTVERLREGVTIVLAGPPNAGKSSLFNALLARDAAIVTSQAGTTRDTLEAVVQRGGTAFVLIDTAGLRQHTDDAIERIGMERADRAIGRADLVLWLGDPGKAPDGAVLVHARADAPDRAPAPTNALATAVNDPASIAALWTHLQQRAAEIIPAPSGALLHREQRERVIRAHVSLTQATVETDLLLMAEQLRTARVDLASLLGVDATEAMLDALFARFCVGK
ncbi:tRNA modification GTPase trmE [Sphingomonas palmae]|uniref:tRNA modification GTPase MnmE n=1 Tax=Sphingomonas palmae TaxID=1855283 RepID=A0A1H7S2J7_9SPHN|nr:tRNA uridine-5-carboxymethylaminomethyl(34) synthesis GTPase MnmE [Sphingomonas palmae]SEL65777.1 tRNA modification GTPase trmE [Sphingomonas palmae]